MNEDEAASKIQASFKGYKTRKEMNVKKQQVRDDIDKREQNKHESEAATKIQSSFRGYKTRKEYKRKQDTKAEVEVEAVKGTDINDNEKKTDGEKVDEKAKEDAATTIQSNYRGYKSRKSIQEIRDAKAKSEEIVKNDTKQVSEDEAATRIQAGFKGYKTRKNLAGKSKKELEAKESNSDKELDNAASTIQANYKGYKVRKEYETSKQKQREDKAATRIQANYKGYKTRKVMSKQKEQQQMPDQAPSPKQESDELDKAATKIQSGFRGYKARKEFKTKVTDDEIVETDADQLPESVCTNVSAKKSQFLLVTKFMRAADIQRAFRCFARRENIRNSRANLKNLNQAFFEGDYTDLDISKRTRAAIKIQTKYREYTARTVRIYPILAVDLFHGVIRGYMTRKVEADLFEGHKIKSVPNRDHYSTIIQSLCWGFMTRREEKTRLSIQEFGSKGKTQTYTSDVSYWKESNIKMYSDKTLRKSAAKIQASIYGYCTRRKYDRIRVVEKAADFMPSEREYVSVLQACFRGYLIRKQVAKCTGQKRENESSQSGDKFENGFADKTREDEHCGTEDKECVQDVDETELESTYAGNVKDDCKSSKESGFDEPMHLTKKLLDISEKRCRKRSTSEISKKSRNLSMRSSDIEFKEERTYSEFSVMDSESRSTQLSRQSGNSLKSGSLVQEFGNGERCDSGLSMNTWKNTESQEEKNQEINKEGLREVVDDGNAVCHLQAAFRACMLRKELRRELSELRGGGEELVDIRIVNMDISSLRRDFRLKSGKARRLGSCQFDKTRSPDLKNKWLKHGDTGNEDCKENNSSPGTNKLEQETSADKVSRKEDKPKFSDPDKLKELDHRENALKLKAAFYGHSKRKRKNYQCIEDAKCKIIAAFRGHKIRKTKLEYILKTETVLRSLADVKMADVKPESPTVHVKMHSDVVKERVKHLQAAFAGYQTRNVFISLTKLVEQSDSDIGDMQLNKIESLSETDDFKLKHKSMVKMHATYEHFKGGENAKTKVDPQNKLDSNSLGNTKSGVDGQDSCLLVTSRPSSGVIIRKTLSYLDFTGIKSRTQPELLNRKTSDLRELSGIEMYIQKKVAATHLQSCARSWLTRKHFKATKNNISRKCIRSVGSKTTVNMLDPEMSEELFNEKQQANHNVAQTSSSTSSNGQKPSQISDNLTPHPRLPKETYTENRKSPTSVKSNGSKIPVRTTKEPNYKEKDITELMKARTASIKMEAEKRKLLAEEARLKQHSTKETDSKQEQVLQKKIHGVHSPSQTSLTDRSFIDTKHSAKSSSKKSLNTSENDSISSQDQERAAVIIQKMFRGFSARKNVVENQKTKKRLENEYRDWKTKRISAAVAIQSAWRGYSARKELQEQPDSIDSSGLHVEPPGLHVEPPGLLVEPPGLLDINIGRSKSEIERANRRYDNACMIQMVVKACHIRRVFGIKSSLRRLTKGKAASKLQAAYWGSKTRRQFKTAQCATRIQSICRAFMTRRLQAELSKKKTAERHAAATRLQAVYQSFRRKRQNEAGQRESRRNQATIGIQAAVRGYIARWKHSRKQAELQTVAANKIQASIRGYRARKERKERRKAVDVIISSIKALTARKEHEAYLRNLEEERLAATRLQAGYKSYISRKMNQDCRLKLQMENKAATDIQSFVRGKMARQKHELWKGEQARKQEVSAMRIQSTYRGHMGRKRVKSIRHEIKRQRSALKIQSTYRGHLGRKMAAGKRLEKKRERSALSIQAMYRGHLGRKEARKEKHIKEVYNIATEMVQLLVERSGDHCRKRDESVERIQATAKSYLTRIAATSRMSDTEKIRMKERKKWASVIQTVVRAKQRRDRVSAKVMVARVSDAARKIQSRYRGYRVRRYVEKEKEMLANIKPPGSAMISARTKSGKLVTVSVDDVLSANSRAIILFHKKATELQSAVRAFLTRKEMVKRLIRKANFTKTTPRQVLSSAKSLRNWTIDSSNSKHMIASRKQSKENIPVSKESNKGSITVSGDKRDKSMSNFMINRHGVVNEIERKSIEERLAAVKIQRVFREYLARKQDVNDKYLDEKDLCEEGKTMKGVVGDDVTSTESETKGTAENRNERLLLVREKMKTEAANMISTVYRNFRSRQTKRDERVEM